MKEKQEHIHEKNILEIVPEDDVYKNIVSISKINGGSFGHYMPFKVNSHYLIMVVKGSVDININGIIHNLKENMVLDVFQTETAQFINVSPDALAYQMIITKDFLIDVMQQRKQMPMSYVTSLLNNPYLIVTGEQMEVLRSRIEKAREEIRNTDHFFQKELLQYAILVYFIEIGNIVVQRTELNRINPVTNRKDDILAKFLYMASENYRERHDISFYAEKLFITPQYLSRVLKQLTGRTVNDYISDMLVTDAKRLLRTSRTSIMEISELLNFSDQASFGKFFKKHTGFSPLKYRRSSH